MDISSNSDVAARIVYHLDQVTEISTKHRKRKEAEGIKTSGVFKMSELDQLLGDLPHEWHEHHGAIKELGYLLGSADRMLDVWRLVEQQRPGRQGARVVESVWQEVHGWRM